MKAIKKTIAMTVLSALLMTGFAFAIPTTVSAAYDNNVTFTIDGTNAALPGYDHSNVYLFPNTGSSARTISYSSYNFRYSKLMIFNASGRVVECGGNLYDGSSTVTGAPQVTVTIPAGGFMIAFGANNTKFMNIYNVVMEGAVLYNATMSVIYEAYASYSGSTLTVKYNNPKPASENAISFLFVGNSSTYFNGTPIKFKAMAAAAGIEIDVVYCTYGSAFLSEYADPNHERGKAFRNHLASRKFDYVVLQDASGRDYNTTKPAVQTLLPLIEANGAEALLYMRYSAASTVDQIITNAIKHHNNYATLAKDYNLVCAPAADAFVHYAEKYNDPYTLYASDGGHHSKEGSYLIAATWLYSYLGVDPVGNTYTADMSSDMVQKLQECAKIACEEGYAYPGMDNDYQEDGVYYKNIAKGKTYTVNGEIYSRDDGKWMDTDANGKILGRLTDGTVATDGSDTANVCWKGNTVEVTVNLEGVYNIKNIRLDLHGNTSWGITDPATTTVKAAVSMDGTNFTEIGTATMGSESGDGNWKAREFNLKTGSNNLSAKYVKIILSNDAYARYWSSEIRIYGNESNNVANDANIALNKTYTAEGIYLNNGSIPYPDEDGKSMTDGIVGTSGSTYSDPAYAGFNKGTNAYTANGYASITVDLGKTYDLDKFVAFAGTSYDKNGAAGITAPASMSVYVSNDNSNWTKAGEANFKDDTSKGCEALEITATTGATGRYVQYRFVANKNWMMIAEVEAYGTESTVQPEPDEPTEPDYRLGDVNNDKTVDSLDYLLVKRACFDTYELSDAEFKCADVNEDGVMDSTDYLLVKRIAFGTYKA